MNIESFLCFHAHTNPLSCCLFIWCPKMYTEFIVYILVWGGAPHPFSFPSHINGGSWLPSTSLGYKIRTFTHPKERNHIIIMSRVLCLWLHEVRISFWFLFDLSFMLKDLHAMAYTSFMKMVRMNSGGYGSGSSS